MTGSGAIPNGRFTDDGGDFFIADIFGASPKDDLASMEHPLFSLSTRPDRRVLTYEHNGAEITVTPSVKGRATIHDKDILIFCVSQLIAALNAGRTVARTLKVTAHDLLVATNRDTSGDGYARLREAFERLAGTRITTNIVTGEQETTSGFGLIDSWKIVRRTRGGRMASVSVTLSEWLYRAVLARSVLTLSRDYFRLRKPLERRIYELARKHCGRQPSWTVSMAVLHKKAGSAAPLRVFRASVRKTMTAGLPEYRLIEEPGDLVRFERIRSLNPTLPRFAPEVLDEARALAPGLDVHALEAEWRSWAEETGARLTRPDRAFLGWVKTRAAQG
ncbi:replication initiator protein A [Palleronia sp.]|uniref:replication initiator protein A n=1 Tax=Palleronia sp. TaxID=1940284 RepID=UPI0035C8005A